MDIKEDEEEGGGGEGGRQRADDVLVGHLGSVFGGRSFIFRASLRCQHLGRLKVVKRLQILGRSSGH